MLEKPLQPRVIELGEVVADVRVEYPVHPPPGDRDRERVQRIMRTSLGPEPIGKAEEVALVDRIQHLSHRPLDNLVLKRGDPERSLPPIGLRYVRPARRPRPVRAPVDPGVKIAKVLLEILPIVPPRDTVNPRCRARTNRPVRQLQALDGHVMQKRGEPRVLVLSCYLAHAIQPT